METEHTHSHHHGTLRHIRKRRKHRRKLRDNPQLLVSVVAMVIFGLVLVALMIWLLSTSSCQTPKILR